MTQNEFENITAEFREEFQKKLEHNGVLYSNEIQLMAYKHILGIDDDWIKCFLTADCHTGIVKGGLV